MKIFRLPDVGEGLAEASIVQWHVAAGENVKADQLLVSVETAKAVVDIPSPRAGRILRLLADVGAVVATHAPLLEFSNDDEANADTRTDHTRGNSSPPHDNSSVVGQLSQHSIQRTESFIIGRHRHTEARLQQQAARRQNRHNAAAPAASTRVSATNAAFSGGEALSPQRRQMAENLQRAHQEVALVTLMDHATPLCTDTAQLSVRLLRALAAAARAEPALNAWYDSRQQTRLLHSALHVGVAVDTPQGLYVPVLRDVQMQNLAQLQVALDALKHDAHAHRLTASQQQGATLTLSNFGAISGSLATPLVSPPQVAILGAGRLQEGRLPLSLSFDHRAVTGGEAARFLAAVIADLALP